MCHHIDSSRKSFDLRDASCLSSEASLLAPRTSQWTGVTRYPTPLSWACSDFPLSTSESDHRAPNTIQQLDRLSIYSASTLKSFPRIIELLSTKPALVSTTYKAGTKEANESGYESGDTFSSI